MVYVSVRGRVWLQAEAANMVESVGNYVKHRRAPIIVKSEEGDYVTYFVPTISGESVAHVYQTILAKKAEGAKEPVCSLCKRGIFLKSTNKDVIKDAISFEPPEAKGKKADTISIADQIEEAVIKGCTVEDVGGFLYAGNPNVKRTSNFYTGYMVPVKEVLSSVSIDPQLQSRYALGTKFVGAGESNASGQMIYYVEVSSALFTFAFDLDTSLIGKRTFNVSSYGSPVIKDQDIKERSKASLDALKELLLEFPVGAKRTRFDPVDKTWESIAIATSDDVWTLPSPFSSDYIERAKAKISKVSNNTKVFTYPKNSGIQSYDTFEEAVINAIEEAKKRV
ncbi:type I-A CRISPR-associated protein Cas7/Csa2 [Acidianus sp. RZ1]|uniref:type I-A CRISPR-associated protein Cas7/Csa2 n=1 Tax=Acidianus sp. RZ1 TaxID=1540082 RepID=UPI001491F7D8|nr:type I-A CRISPR-associated protein Cas7/Csa2 [Acidianus sp. RZ1]NON61640.1 type I-A CRISPR-associated protein Cas7/Csa2 [Acidianus sp. RZ1]